MKVLKLYGEKDDFKGFIAEICIEGNKVMVESENKEVEKELSDAIDQVIEKGDPFYLPDPHQDEGVIWDGFSCHKLGDPQFLEALHAEFWDDIGLGQHGKFGYRKYGGYKIKAYKSEIVER